MGRWSWRNVASRRPACGRAELRERGRRSSPSGARRDVTLQSESWRKETHRRAPARLCNLVERAVRAPVRAEEAQQRRQEVIRRSRAARSARSARAIAENAARPRWLRDASLRRCRTRAVAADSDRPRFRRPEVARELQPHLNRVRANCHSRGSGEGVAGTQLSRGCIAFAKGRRFLPADRAPPHHRRRQAGKAVKRPLQPKTALDPRGSSVISPRRLGRIGRFERA
jgi:hypothetical protein